MRKLAAIIISVLFMSLIPGTTLVRSEPLPAATELEAQDNQVIIGCAVSCFSFYSSFLADYFERGEYMIPVHGSCRQEARSYLNQGFTPEMSNAIIDECTAWDNVLASLTLLPGDGIPVLTAEDTKKVEVYLRDTNKVVLLMQYNNCYSEGDRYQFLITMIPDGDTWKISGLSFNPAK